jgi:hypothetical protein
MPPRIREVDAFTPRSALFLVISMILVLLIAMTLVCMLHARKRARPTTFDEALEPAGTPGAPSKKIRPRTAAATALAAPPTTASAASFLDDYDSDADPDFVLPDAMDQRSDGSDDDDDDDDDDVDHFNDSDAFDDSEGADDAEESDHATSAAASHVSKRRARRAAAKRNKFAPAPDSDGEEPPDELLLEGSDSDELEGGDLAEAFAQLPFDEALGAALNTALEGSK